MTQRADRNQRKRGVLGWPIILAALILMGIGFTVAMRNIRVDLADAQARQTEVSRELIMSQDEYRDLSAQLLLVGSDSYIENMARQHYDFLKPGELRFEISNPELLNNYTEEELHILTEERQRK